LDSDNNILIDKREKKEVQTEADLIVELNGWKSEIRIL